MWEINLASQVVSFLYAMLTGVFLSVFFDFFRAARKNKKFTKIAVFFQDIAFFMMATIVTFLLLIARSNGEIRAYILFGEALGFFLFRITLSVFFLRFLMLFIKVFGQVSRIYRKIIELAADFLCDSFKKISFKLSKIIKKVKIQGKNS